MLLHQHRWFAMGTLFEAFLIGDDDEHLEAVASAVEEDVRRLDSLLSRFDPASEIARLNREAGHRPVRVSLEVGELLAACEVYKVRTFGAFDVTVGSTGQGSLDFAPGSPAISFPNPGTRVDLGGIGKGYALDRVKVILHDFGITHGLLHAGTSSGLSLGPGAEGRPWVVDVRDPANDDNPPVARLTLVHRAYSCSAARRAGQGESDLLDSRTLRPIAGDAGCVVLTDSATDAEVLSTALLVLGRQEALRYLEDNHWPGVHVAWIDGGRFDWLTEAP